MSPCACLSDYKTNQESEQDTERQENIVMIGIEHNSNDGGATVQYDVKHVTLLTCTVNKHDYYHCC